MGEPVARDATDTAPFLGMGARATYAISNWYAFEASLGYGRLREKTLHTVDTEAGDVTGSWHQFWFQADLGITARLGVRVIPTLHAAIGLQRRTWQRGHRNHGFSPHCDPEPGKVDEPCWYDVPEQVALELVGTLGAGLDYRLGDAWIAGLNVAAQRAALDVAHFHTFAVTFHLSYYFYPEGAGP